MFTGKPLSRHIEELCADPTESTREVVKANTGGGIPVGFTNVQKPLRHILAEGYYRKKRVGDTISIAEYPGFYLLKHEQTGVAPTHSIDPNQLRTNLGSNGIDLSKAKIGGALAIGLGLAAAFASSSSDDSSSTTTSTPTPQTPITAPREKDYNLFVSHAWDYSGEYQRLCNLLNNVDDFSWRNYSVPETDPKDVDTNAELTEALVAQIRPASAVVLSAGMYSNHRNWIQKEIRIADEQNKPIIAVKPHGNTRWPSVVENSSARRVNWNGASVASAIAEEVDGE